MTADHCEMCAALLAGDERRHLLDLAHHALLSICNACALAFGPRGANAGSYRLIPTRHLALLNFQATDGLWAGSGRSAKIAYLLRSSEAGHVLAVYLDPAGARESAFDLEHWKTLLTANPLLDSLEPDVEALLINRMGQEQTFYIVPITTCSQLVGLLTEQGNEQEIWKDPGAFFEKIQAGASPTITVNNQEARHKRIGGNDQEPGQPAEKRTF